MNNKFAIAIHGGAGTILKKNLTAKLEEQFRTTLKESIESGYKVLLDGGTSLDAVTASVVVMENSELFNAGKGAVFTHDETNEMDASIMCGKSLECGAVTNLTHVKNPIYLANKVLSNSDHVLLAGEGAEKFAKLHNIELVDKEYFFTKRRFFQLKMAKDKSNKVILDHDGDNDKHGTVGAVALDVNGNLAAATSSGGMTNKKYNRIGDTPIIGAGTYANNQSCAISTTGHGEYFMRLVTSYDVHANMVYGKLTLSDATEITISNLTKLGGSGGLIGVDKNGNIAMPMNCAGMYRASMAENEKQQIKIFKDE